MRRFAFIIAVLGMVILLFILSFGKMERIESYEKLEELEVNKRVFIVGEVVEEKIIFGARKVLVLENGVQLVCECAGNFKEKKVEVEGIVSEFEGKKQIEVLRINVN